MSKTLIALATLAAGAVLPDSPAYDVGAKFTAPDDVANRLVVAGEAKLDEAPLAAPPPARAAKRAKVRLLVDSALGNCNDVVEVDAKEVKKLESDGLADGDSAAVAYAAGLPQNKIE